MTVSLDETRLDFRKRLLSFKSWQGSDQRNLKSFPWHWVATYLAGPPMRRRPSPSLMLTRRRAVILSTLLTSIQRGYPVIPAENQKPSLDAGSGPVVIAER